MHTLNGWPTYEELAAGLPYTIVVGRGSAARKSLPEFHCDHDAIRWAGTTLADRGERVRLYRGRQARGTPLVELHTPRK
jgi:hypothetical protein